MTETKRMAAEIRALLKRSDLREMSFPQLMTNYVMLAKEDLPRVLEAAVTLRAALATAMRVHIMDDEQIDETDDLLAKTAWLADSPEAGGEEGET